MEISQIEPRLEDTQDEYEKAQKFKKYVQDLSIDYFSQEEFKRRVDAIFNEKFKGERRWVKKLYNFRIIQPKNIPTQKLNKVKITIINKSGIKFDAHGFTIEQKNIRLNIV